MSAELEERIAQLEQRLNSHDRKFRRIYEIVYQIMGKIFNHLTEMDYIYNYWNYMVFNRHIDTHIEDIDTEHYLSDEDIDTDDEDADLDSV